MGKFTQANHLLQVEEDCSKIVVYKLTEVASYSINGTNNPLRVSVENDEFELEYSKTAEVTGCHKESIVIANTDEMAFRGSDFIGAADIRDMRIRHITYHLDVCPIYLKKPNVTFLEIQAPCSTDGSPPNTGCREVNIEETNSSN